MSHPPHPSPAPPPQFFTSLLGVIAAPLIIKRIGPQSVFGLSLARQFGTGIVIAVAFIHILLPAVEAFASPCLPPSIAEGYEAWAFAITGVSVLFMQFFEIALQHAQNSLAPSAGHAASAPDDELQPVKSPKPALLPEGHSHGSHGDSCAEEENARSQLQTWIDAITAEFSLSLHSVLVGLTVGVVTDEELKVLVIALVFHQFFEGISLGVSLMTTEPQWGARAAC